MRSCFCSQPVGLMLPNGSGCNASGRSPSALAGSSANDGTLHIAKVPNMATRVETSQRGRRMACSIRQRERIGFEDNVPVSYMQFHHLGPFSLVPTRERGNEVRITRAIPQCLDREGRGRGEP